MTVCGGSIYITGGKGEDSLEACDTILKYNPQAGSIEQVTSMPRAACYHGCVTIHRYAGGKQQAAGSSKSLQWSGDVTMTTIINKWKHIRAKINSENLNFSLE